MACVIAARNEADRVPATVRAAAKIDGVGLVVVVDDGSDDDTWKVAEAAGARVHRHVQNRGKAAAMTSGAALVSRLDDNDAPRLLLFLDADLADTAAAAAPLVEPVRSGAADMTVGVLPPQRLAGGENPGGHGLVVWLSRAAISRATGWAPRQPLSGQRCLTREAFTAALPLARGFGVETGLSLDLGRLGFRIVEVPIDVGHRATGTDWRAQVHRGRQWLQVARAVATRRIWTPAALKTNPPEAPAKVVRR